MALVKAKAEGKIDESETVWIGSLLHKGLLVRKRGTNTFMLSLGAVQACGVLVWPVAEVSDSAGKAWQISTDMKQDPP